MPDGERCMKCCNSTLCSCAGYYAVIQSQMFWRTVSRTNSVRHRETRPAVDTWQAHVCCTAALWQLYLARLNLLPFTALLEPVFPKQKCRTHGLLEHAMFFHEAWIHKCVPNGTYFLQIRSTYFWHTSTEEINLQQSQQQRKPLQFKQTVCPPQIFLTSTNSTTVSCTS